MSPRDQFVKLATARAISNLRRDVFTTLLSELSADSHGDDRELCQTSILTPAASCYILEFMASARLRRPILTDSHVTGMHVISDCFVYSIVPSAVH